jgi:hypothetical protein
MATFLVTLPIRRVSIPLIPLAPITTISIPEVMAASIMLFSGGPSIIAVEILALTGLRTFETESIILGAMSFFISVSVP